MGGDQMPAPGKIKLIKFPPPGQEKKSNARGMPGGGGMLKLRFDWYIIDHEFCGPANYFENVMTKFTVNNRADAH